MLLCMCMLLLCYSGVDYLTTVVQYSGETIALQFWDTAGQERYLRVCTYIHVYIYTYITVELIHV